MITYSINVGDAGSVKQRYHLRSPAYLAEMYKELDRMLDLVVIEESQGPWSPPPAVVRKGNGKMRLRLDARKVDEVTVKDAYPLPVIEGLLSRLEETKYI